LPSTRSLLADNFAPFRRVVRLILENTPDLLIIGETANDLDTVKKVKELRPELILLDIDLPVLSGLEVAREVLRIAPESKVLFLGRYRSPVLVREALSTGAHGYVVKCDAARELPAAVQTVLMNKLFISDGFEDYNLIEPQDA
jgi:DNA-binding NarL/FixJ family response regulator